MTWGWKITWCRESWEDINDASLTAGTAKGEEIGEENCQARYCQTDVNVLDP